MGFLKFVRVIYFEVVFDNKNINTVILGVKYL